LALENKSGRIYDYNYEIFNNYLNEELNRLNSILEKKYELFELTIEDW